MGYKIDISFDTAEAIAVQVIKDLVIDNPKLKPFADPILAHLMKPSELREWLNVTMREDL